MTLQYSAGVVNAQADVIETTIGTSPLLGIFTGGEPANTATANSGSLLCTMALPSDWLAAAALGVKTILGTWQNTSAGGAGTAGYFRIYNTAGTTCFLQGNVSITAGGGDLVLDNNVIAVGQQVTITAFTLTMGNFP